MEGSTAVLVAVAVIGAGFAAVTFVVQELMRSSGAGVMRMRLEATLEAMESLAYDTPRATGPAAVIDDPWGERGPQSLADARTVLLQVLAETPVGLLAADAALWRRVQRTLTVSRTAPIRPPEPPPAREPTR